MFPRIFTLSTIMLLLGLQAVYAYGQYYVEVGSELEEEEAIEKWKTLSKKYPNTLGKLEFYPTTVIHKQNNRITTRIQAGPVRTKLDAYRICGKLFDDNMPCFVVEGMNHEPRTRIASQPVEPKEKPKPLPWLVKAPEPVEKKSLPAVKADDSSQGEAENTKEERGLFSWLADSLTFEDEIEIKSRDLAPQVKYKVEVAEAIRVPLSTQTMAGPRIGFADDDKVVQPFTASDYAQANQNASGWLMVERFNSQRRATDFWRALRHMDAYATDGLNVRIKTPLQSESKKNTRLYIGRFSGLSEANRFCKDMVRKKNKNLNCRFLAGKELNALGDDSMNPKKTRSQRYDNRRRRLSSGGAIRLKKVYWLHVATAKTQMRALQTWDALRKKHPDLLDGLRSSVSATLSKKKRYMLRIGPLPSGSAASELCGALYKRKVFCRVYTNM